MSKSPIFNIIINGRTIGYVPCLYVVNEGFGPRAIGTHFHGDSYTRMLKVDDSKPDGFIVNWASKDPKVPHFITHGEVKKGKSGTDKYDRWHVAPGGQEDQAFIFAGHDDLSVITLAEYGAGFLKDGDLAAVKCGNSAILAYESGDSVVYFSAEFDAKADDPITITVIDEDVALKAVEEYKACRAESKLRREKKLAKMEAKEKKAKEQKIRNKAAKIAQKAAAKMAVSDSRPVSVAEPSDTRKERRKGMTASEKRQDTIDFKAKKGVYADAKTIEA